jgi:hypothetical protein
MVEWTVGRYQTDAGEIPVDMFLASLTGVQAQQAAALIGLLAMHGNALRPPQSKQVEPGLWELRRHQVRIFYTFRPGRRVILLDGIVKKQDDIPREVIERLRRYLADLERQERPPRGR